MVSFRVKINAKNIVADSSQMMAAFNVTALEGLGYDNVQGLADPTDSRFVAQWWSADAYEDNSIQSTISYLGGLGAYNQRTEIVQAIVEYYSTNPSAAIETGTPVSVQAWATPTTTYSAGGGSNSWWGHGAAPTQTQSWGSNQDWSHRGNAGQNWGQKQAHNWQG